MPVHTSGLWTAHPDEAKPPAGAVLDPSNALARSVVGCWMFNEAAGLKGCDAGPLGLHARYSTGNNRFGSRAGINGLATAAAGRWQTAPHPLLNPARCSIEFYALMAATFSASTGIIWLGSSTANNGISLRTPNSTGVTLFVNNSSAAAGTYPVANKPVHVVAVYGGAAVGDQRIYINGLLSASTATSLTVSYANQIISFGTGPSAGATGSYFLDYAVLYNRPLSAQEVMERYCRPYSIVALPRAASRIAFAQAAPPNGWQAHYPDTHGGGRLSVPCPY